MQQVGRIASPTKRIRVYERWELPCDLESKGEANVTEDMECLYMWKEVGNSQEAICLMLVISANVLAKQL